VEEIKEKKMGLKGIFKH